MEFYIDGAALPTRVSCKLVDIAATDVIVAIEVAVLVVLEQRDRGSPNRPRTRTTPTRTLRGLEGQSNDAATQKSQMRDTRLLRARRLGWRTQRHPGPRARSAWQRRRSGVGSSDHSGMICGKDRGSVSTGGAREGDDGAATSDDAKGEVIALHELTSQMAE